MKTTIAFPAYQFVGSHVTYPTLTSAVAVTLPTSGNANGWLLQATGANVRIKFDGNSPSASSGFQIRAGDPPFLFIAPNPNFFFYAIQEAATGILETQPISQPTV